MSKSIAEEIGSRRAATEQQQEEATHLWVVSYSDFITILMIFFLILFGHRVMTKRTSWDVLFRAAEEAQKGMVQRLARLAAVEVQAQRINIHLPDTLLFESGRADLKASAQHLLGQISPELAVFKGQVIVEGHTDDRPLGSHARYRSNWELSAARAFTVIRCLTSHGVDPERLSARGYGPYRPRALNDTSAHRAENRRIEIILLTTPKEGPSNAP